VHTYNLNNNYVLQCVDWIHWRYCKLEYFKNINTRYIWTAI